MKVLMTPERGIMAFPQLHTTWVYTAYDALMKPLPNGKGVVKCRMMGTAYAMAREALMLKGVSWWGVITLEPRHKLKAIEIVATAQKFEEVVAVHWTVPKFWFAQPTDLLKF